MRIYRVEYFGEPGDQQAQHGFSFHRNLAEAYNARRHGMQPYEVNGEIVRRSAKVEPIDVEPTKNGIIKALNQYAGHPDNG